ncbi:MAG: hypothetical protein AB1424_09010 [Thermodesulfobacteriota bacterium]
MGIPEMVRMSGVNTDKIEFLLCVEQAVIKLVEIVKRFLPPEQYSLYRQHLAAKLLLP